MKNSRTMTTIGGVLLTATLALAQTAPPARRLAPAAPMPVAAAWPQAAGDPQPAAAPQPPAAPQAPVAAQAPAAPRALRLNDLVDLDVNLNLDLAQDWLKDQKYDLKYDEKWQEAQEKAATKYAEKYSEAADKYAQDGKFLAMQMDQMKTPRAMTPPMPPTPPIQIFRGNAGRGSDEGFYQRGINAIDSHHYDEALEDFNQVVAHAGTRTEGGLYWKAYTLNKLGRSADAQAAIEQLRKSYPSSHWLDDAKVLELEVKQSTGKPVSPEGETDEDIKILALNGLMQSDPERALPQVENLLKTSHSPRLKRQAIIVLGLNSSPRAKQDLEQLARGGNPDVQLEAIRYLGRAKDANNGQLFSEIYAASNDVNVKRAILSTYTVTRDKDRLVAIAKTEKNNDLRDPALRALGELDGQPELWQIYQGETPEGKETLLGYMHQNGSMDKLSEVARTDKEVKLRLAAVRAIASQRTGTPSTVLVSVYTAPDQDVQVKRSIVNNLAGNRNGGKALVEIARSEKDMSMKLRIVEQLSGMAKNSPEARDYLQEILSK